MGEKIDMRNIYIDGQQPGAQDKKDGDPNQQGKSPENQQPKAPRVRRIVGAQVLNENG